MFHLQLHRSALGLRGFALMLVVLVATIAGAQQIQGIQIPVKKDHVTYIPDEQNLVAGRATVLTLHFTVQTGYHINSHTPHDASLIPTKIALVDGDGFTVQTVDFPKGKEYSFAFSPEEKLDVYTGDFALTVHLTAKPGSHTMKAALHYQACDSASCYPPRNLPIEVSFTAK